jgi:hypothetical protein
MTQDTLDFNPAPQVVHCPCCPTQKANRRAIDANVVRVGRRNPETSHKAAQGVLPRTGTKRRALYNLIDSRGVVGMTDHEIEQVTGWHTNTSRSTRNGLMNDGWIWDSGVRRKTPQGHNAIVWISRLV